MTQAIDKGLVAVPGFLTYGEMSRFNLVKRLFGAVVGVGHRVVDASINLHTATC